MSGSPLSDIREVAAPTWGRWSGTVVFWGAVVGVVNAAAWVGLWWVEPATVYALGLALIAGVYIGFAVADGRPRVIAIEAVVAMIFVVLGAAAVTGAAWLLVLGYAGHGFKDLWQHRRRFVANTRWWPPFCAVVDWIVAAVIAVEIAMDVQLYG